MYFKVQASDWSLGVTLASDWSLGVTHRGVVHAKQHEVVAVVLGAHQHAAISFVQNLVLLKLTTF